MGKSRTIKIIAGLVAGMASHKILCKYTNKPESINHMQSEIDNYRVNISEEIIEFNWNEKDKEKIKEESRKILEKKLKEDHFNDVSFPKNQAKIFLDETLNEVFS